MTTNEHHIPSSHDSLAAATAVCKVLGLYPGAVSPFGIINDTENRVELLIDPCLVGQRLLFHPNTNTRTVSIAYDDLIKFIESQKHSYTLLN